MLSLGIRLLLISSFSAFCVGQEPLFAPPSNASDMGKITFTGTDQTVRFNLGRVKAGVQSWFVMHLVNSTPEIFEIDDVTTSCGCMLAVPVTKQVQPNASEDFFMSFAPKEIGESRRHITIKARTGTASVVVVAQVESNALPLLSISPKEFAIADDGAIIGGGSTLVAKDNFDNIKSLRLSVLNDSLDLRKLDSEDQTEYAVINREWTWRPGEVERYVPLVAKNAGGTVVFEDFIVIRNPNGCSIRPTVAHGRRDTEGKTLFRFYVRLGKELSEKPEIEFEVKGDRGVARYEVGKVSRMAREVVAIEVSALFVEERSSDTSEETIRWLVDGSQIGITKVVF